MVDSRERPISIAILAVGGQGGGVLTNWLVDVAEANGYLAQSTFVAGVAQRTGATVYCVEMFPRDRAEAIGKDPVFTPYPVPGDVDLVVAGEMAETGRAIQKGFVTPNITTLIASSHRIYSVLEKDALGDGIFDQAPVADAAQKAAKKFICFDMAAAAASTGSVISSVILGAIAGSGTLPFPREAFEDAIRASGRAVEANLAGFAAGFDGVGEHAPPRDVAIPVAEPAGPNGAALNERIDRELPEAVRNLALHGALRVLDYQDAKYAAAYLDRVKEISVIDTGSNEYHLTAEVARQLALQMCYEDTIRVADLKTRGERFARIRDDVVASPDQPVHVIEYFHPRIEEICDTLPAPIGAFILNSETTQKILSPFFKKGRNIKTTGVMGFLMLYVFSKFRRFRRFTYRFKKQQELIHDWLDRVINAAVDDYDYALAIAHCIEIVRGYGDTYQRGLTRYRAAVDVAAGLPPAERTRAMHRLHKAALADEQGQVFGETIATMETVH
ncbi:MAG: indolepyruvate oxidoreductase subunit beta family protein [Woeseiaceae bacterium]|nr:indolepyruvate oxidoreductase subunit beta family protein [Woeseiaceae bacterium]